MLRGASDDCKTHSDANQYNGIVVGAHRRGRILIMLRNEHKESKETP